VQDLGRLVNVDEVFEQTDRIKSTRERYRRTHVSFLYYI